MIQLIINSTLIREIDDRALINRYAKFFYDGDISVEDDDVIKRNLIELLDWDKNGDHGVPTYCSRFESIKRKDWPRLIQFIKDNRFEIKDIARPFIRKKKLESKKVILDKFQKKKLHYIERFNDENYEVTTKGKKAKTCIYKGRFYKSRQQCVYKEGITKYALYKYLEETGQL